MLAKEGKPPQTFLLNSHLVGFILQKKITDFLKYIKIRVQKSLDCKNNLVMPKILPDYLHSLNYC